MGWQVYGIDSVTYAANKNLIYEFGEYDNFTFVKEDIANIDYLPDCDYVINVAAESHVGNSIVDSNDFIHTNVLGVKNLLDLIRKKQNNVSEQPIFLHFSTDEVYGDIESGSHIETDILKPSNPYSASKASSDMLIFAWARTYGIKYLIVRPTNNYGIGQYPEKLIPVSVKMLQRGKKIRLHDEGEPIRNWLHADDTAAAVIKIIESGNVNQIYNIAGGFEQKNKETVQKIVHYYFGDDRKFNDYVDLGYKREGQDVRYALDDTKLRSLGWKPQKVFDDEIQGIVEYYKNNFKW
jgi:dTDP-glucose 4,6-dehydratase